MQRDHYERHSRSIPYVESSYDQQDAATIHQLRQERQPQQMLILTVVSPELHFDVVVGLCVEGTISEVCHA